MWLLERSVDNVEEVAEDYLLHLIRNYRKGIREIAEGATYRRPFDVVRKAVEDSLEEIGLIVDPEVIDEGIRLFRWLHVENSTPYPEVEEFLQKLKDKGFKLGVITNSFEKHLQLILSKLNMLHYFSCLVDGGDVKAFKPMKEPFLRAIECLGVDFAETLFVGDEYYADIVGSTCLGIDAVWVNNRGGDLETLVTKYGEISRPILVVESVLELEEYL
jgi:FMN phosphatase YigB (HAD superfamily)